MIASTTEHHAWTTSPERSAQDQAGGEGHAADLSPRYRDYRAV
jgi:hypothetical protein